MRDIQDSLEIQATRLWYMETLAVNWEWSQSQSQRFESALKARFRPRELAANSLGTFAPI